MVVGLRHCTVSNLDNEVIGVTAVDGQRYLTAELVHAFISVRLEGERTRHVVAFDMVSPFRVTTIAGWLMVEADSTVLLIVNGSTVFVITDDKSKVLICICCVRIDAEVELCVPGLTVSNLIILREGCPPSCAIVSSSNGVHIFHHAF